MGITSMETWLEAVIPLADFIRVQDTEAQPVITLPGDAGEYDIEDISIS